MLYIPWRWLYHPSNHTTNRDGTNHPVNYKAEALGVIRGLLALWCIVDAECVQ
jgi:hypothetical protein